MRVYTCFSHVSVKAVAFLLLIIGASFRVLLTVVQIDLKCMIAFSSVRHMTLLLASLYRGYRTLIGVNLAILFLHGVTARNLFFFSYLLHGARGRRLIFLNQGMNKRIKVFYYSFLLTAFMNIGFPPCLSFFSEVLLFERVWEVSFLSVLAIFMCSFFSCVYTIYLSAMSFHGRGHNLNSLA